MWPSHLFLPYYPNRSPADVLRASLLSCFSSLLVAFSVMLFQTDPYEITCVSTLSVKDCMELLPKLYIPFPTTYKIRCVQTHTHTPHTYTHTHMAIFLSSLFFSRTGNEATSCTCSMYTRMKDKSRVWATLHKVQISGKWSDTWLIISAQWALTKLRHLVTICLQQ